MARYDLTILPGYRVGDDGTVSKWIKRRKAWKEMKITDDGKVTVAAVLTELVNRAETQTHPAPVRPGHFTRYAQSVFVLLKLIGTSPNPSPFTSISTVLEHNSDSASNLNREARATYWPLLVIIDSQIRDSA